MVAAIKPRVWTVFVAYALVLVVIVGVAIVLAVVGFALWLQNADVPSSGDPQALAAVAVAVTQQPWLLQASSAATAVALAATALLAARLSPTPLVERLRIGPARGGWQRFTLIGLTPIAAIASGAAVSSALQILFGKSAVLEALTREMRSTGAMLALTFVNIAVLTPIGEELFFRGYAQTRLVARFGRVAGILIATALFALMHFDPMHVAGAFAIGSVLAWTTERAGSVRPAVVAHAVNNGLFVFASQAEDSSVSWGAAGVLAIVAVLAIASIGYFTRAAA